MAIQYKITIDLPHSLIKGVTTMKKDTKEKEIKQEDELSEEDLKKVAGGKDWSNTLSGLPGKLAGGNSIESIGTEFVNTVKLTR
jgi:hypothetical protein